MMWDPVSYTHLLVGKGNLYCAVRALLTKKPQMERIQHTPLRADVQSQLSCQFRRLLRYFHLTTVIDGGDDAVLYGHYEDRDHAEAASIILMDPIGGRTADLKARALSVLPIQSHAHSLSLIHI